MSEPCRGPSYTGNDIRLVFKHAATRCGKPSAHETIFGPLCDECFDRLKKSRENPHTLGSILKEAADKSPTLESILREAAEERKKRMN